MQKSSSQKALKVISIIMIVCASLGLLAGLIVIVGGSFLGAAGVGASSASALIGGGAIALLGVVVALGAAFNLVTAIFGLRGANDPQKIGVFFVLAIICVVLSAASGLYSIVSDGAAVGSIFSALFGLALPVVGVVLANNIKKENGL